MIICNFNAKLHSNWKQVRFTFRSDYQYLRLVIWKQALLFILFAIDQRDVVCNFNAKLHSNWKQVRFTFTSDNNYFRLVIWKRVQNHKRGKYKLIWPPELPIILFVTLRFKMAALTPKRSIECRKTKTKPITYIQTAQIISVSNCFKTWTTTNVIPWLLSKLSWKPDTYAFGFILFLTLCNSLK